ncbi:hypothetical protein S40285_02234 [Stachybotrys chlorohalonatus IBT 40285]|uniref:F-box domain-containing protein n=1 Tax=Stachybotrys chlorohalonatus (strain IBT 40285) TaxID=1283841 RepID=A0A084QG01_STAC4|nr:hypothetical protein S40285_02234 [Stachybotrys chlorohalonata IBT 40285]
MGDARLHPNTKKYADEIYKASARLDMVASTLMRPPSKDKPLSQLLLHTVFDASPAAGLGVLDRLPAELLFIIIFMLDLRSLFHFRQLNRQTRVLLSEVREYQLTAQHGLEALQRLLCSGLAPAFTIEDLYEPIVSNKCSACGGYGQCLFLFTLEKCCYTCLTSIERYRVVALSTFASHAHISPRRLLRIPALSFRTPSWWCSICRKCSPITLIPYEKAMRILLELGAIGKDTVITLRNNTTTRTILNQLHYRCVSATSYTYYNLEKAKVEADITYCAVCQNIRDPFYSQQEYLSHFAECEAAQRRFRLCVPSLAHLTFSDSSTPMDPLDQA